MKTFRVVPVPLQQLFVCTNTRLVVYPLAQIHEYDEAASNNGSTAASPPVVLDTKVGISSLREIPITSQPVDTSSGLTTPSRYAIVAALRDGSTYVFDPEFNGMGIQPAQIIPTHPALRGAVDMEYVSSSNLIGGPGSGLLAGEGRLVCTHPDGKMSIHQTNSTN